MNTETWIIFGLLAVTVGLFLSDRIRLDLVALLALLALVLTRILTPAEALAGFGDPLLLTIAGLFVVGAGLLQTGVADAVGQRLKLIAGNTERRVIVVTMVLVALFSAVMSSTGTVAVFLPVVVSLAAGIGLSRARLLIPLAYASLLGGMLTLIGTPPNLVVSEALVTAGLQPFTFFDFTPVGVVMLLIGIAFMSLLGPRLLPDRDPPTRVTLNGDDDLVARYQLPGSLSRLRVRVASPLVGRTLADVGLRARYQVNVVEVRPARRKRGVPPVEQARPDTVLRADDLLTVKGEPHNVQRMVREQLLGIVPDADEHGELLSRDLGVAEVLLTPRSRLIGRTLRDARFLDTYHVIVLSILRLGVRIPGPTSQVELRFGDTLLVQGTWEQIAALESERDDVVVVGETSRRTGIPYDLRRGPWAIGIMLGMLGLITIANWPTVTAVLLAALLMILTGCISMEQVYRRMNWESLVLIAGMLPMATALDKSGGMTLLAGGLTATLGTFGPLAVLAGLFALTALFSQFISNTATAVLMAPIALQAAIDLAVAPQPMLIAVAMAASTAFITPIASPVNTLVLGPGGYRFGDFVRVGLPLLLLLLVAVLIVVPFFFPF